MNSRQGVGCRTADKKIAKQTDEQMSETAVIQLNDVSKVYDTGAEPLAVLSGVSLTVEPGETVAVTGPSGCGKSTLLNLIGGLDTPTSGEVSVGGHKLADMAEEELARLRNTEVGFIFQAHHLLPQCTVLENVLLPLLPSGQVDDAARKRAKELLDAVGLVDRDDHRPTQLSGGECQRVAVVRALINDPVVVLADEPTGALDGANAERLVDLLVELNESHGVTVVMVSHAPHLAARMKRSLQLDKGQLVGE
jgi:ABC-type lipoprotein export system ATPase subunit